MIADVTTFDEALKKAHILEYTKTLGESEVYAINPYRDNRETSQVTSRNYPFANDTRLNSWSPTDEYMCNDNIEQPQQNCYKQHYYNNSTRFSQSPQQINHNFNDEYLDNYDRNYYNPEESYPIGPDDYDLNGNPQRNFNSNHFNSNHLQTKHCSQNSRDNVNRYGQQFCTSCNKNGHIAQTCYRNKNKFGINYENENNTKNLESKEGSTINMITRESDKNYEQLKCKNLELLDELKALSIKYGQIISQKSLVEKPNLFLKEKFKKRDCSIITTLQPIHTDKDTGNTVNAVHNIVRTTHKQRIQIRRTLNNFVKVPVPVKKFEKSKKIFKKSLNQLQEMVSIDTTYEKQTSLGQTRKRDAQSSHTDEKDNAEKVIKKSDSFPKLEMKYEKNSQKRKETCAQQSTIEELDFLLKNELICPLNDTNEKPDSPFLEEEDEQTCINPITEKTENKLFADEEIYVNLDTTIKQIESEIKQDRAQRKPRQSQLTLFSHSRNQHNEPKLGKLQEKLATQLAKRLNNLVETPEQHSQIKTIFKEKAAKCLHNTIAPCINEQGGLKKYESSDRKRIFKIRQKQLNISQIQSGWLIKIITFLIIFLQLTQGNLIYAYECSKLKASFEHLYICPKENSCNIKIPRKNVAFNLIIDGYHLSTLLDTGPPTSSY